MGTARHSDTRKEGVRVMLIWCGKCHTWFPTVEAFVAHGHGTGTKKPA